MKHFKSEIGWLCIENRPFQSVRIEGGEVLRAWRSKPAHRGSIGGKKSPFPPPPILAKNLHDCCGSVKGAEHPKGLPLTRSAKRSVNR